MSGASRVWTAAPAVIDSSVAFKWLDPSEPGAQAAIELLRQHQRDEIALVAPPHLALDVLNALISRHADAAAVEQAVALLADAELLIAPLDDTLLAQATQIAFAQGISLQDAVFVALAKTLDAPLVTADRRQACAAAGEVRLIE